MKKISFYNYPSLYLSNKTLYDSVIKNNLGKGQYILGNDLKELEVKLAKFLNVKYCLGMSDATNALTLGLKAMNYKKNSEIIIPSHTFIASMNAIHNSDYMPVVVDIDNSGQINTDLIEKNITQKTKAILSVNLNGECCNYDLLLKICKKNHLDLIEDNAQGFGAKFKNKFAGTFGKFSALSFYPTKILGSFGDGGAIITNNLNIYNIVKRLRNHGRNKINKITDWGTNSRLDNIQSAIILSNLKIINKKISKRRKIAKIYYNLLGNTKEVVLPQIDNKFYNTYQNFEIIVKKRNNLKKYLLKNNIETIIQWNKITLDKVYLPQIKKAKVYKYTKFYFKNCLCLPINESITEYQAKYISKKIIKFYKL